MYLLNTHAQTCVCICIYACIRVLFLLIYACIDLCTYNNARAHTKIIVDNFLMSSDIVYVCARMCTCVCVMQVQWSPVRAEIFASASQDRESVCMHVCVYVCVCMFVCSRVHV